MPGSGGRPKPKHFNRVMRDALLTAGEKATGGNASGEPDTPAPVPAAASGAVPQATAVDAAEGAAAVAYSLIPTRRLHWGRLWMSRHPPPSQRPNVAARVPETRD